MMSELEYTAKIKEILKNPGIPDDVISDVFEHYYSKVISKDSPDIVEYPTRGKVSWLRGFSTSAFFDLFPKQKDRESSEILADQAVSIPDSLKINMLDPKLSEREWENDQKGVVEPKDKFKKEITGQKFDDNKLRIDLVPIKLITGIAKVMTFGAKKYDENSWQNLSHPVKRYKAALLRHLFAWLGGERLDSESGMPHLYHIGANLSFLVFFEDKVTDV